VFFGRFISILRAYAAFLAGANRMKWRRFFLFNAAGGVVWSGIYAVGFYYAGSTLKRLRGPVDIAFAAAGVLAVVASIVWARRHVQRLEEEAERAYPGPF
jgi:membrane protein DedA with SNARE-associated domain